LEESLTLVELSSRRLGQRSILPVELAAVAGPLLQANIDVRRARRLVVRRTLGSGPLGATPLTTTRRVRG